MKNDLILSGTKQELLKHFIDINADDHSEDRYIEKQLDAIYNTDSKIGKVIKASSLTYWFVNILPDNYRDTNRERDKFILYNLDSKLIENIIKKEPENFSLDPPKELYYLTEDFKISKFIFINKIDSKTVDGVIKIILIYMLENLLKIETIEPSNIGRGYFTTIEKAIAEKSRKLTFLLKECNNL